MFYDILIMVIVMIYYYILYILGIYISIIGFINLAGIPFWRGIIPGLNIYYLAKVIHVHWVYLILLTLCIIFLPIRMLFVTSIFFILPFAISYSYGGGFIGGLLAIVAPFLVYPYLAFSKRRYDENENFFSDRFMLFIILFIGSCVVFYLFFRPIEANKLIDKKSDAYFNNLYMSDERIYNEQLTDTQKLMYKDLIKSYKNNVMELDIDFVKYNCFSMTACVTDFYIAHDAIYIDHPEILRASGIGYKKVDAETGTIKLHNALELSFANDLFIYRIERMIDDVKYATKDMTDKQKIIYVYKYIDKLAYYDTAFMRTAKNQSAYNVFIKGNAVCAGFAKTAQILFQNIGIESYSVVGVANGGGHMWNIVKYNDNYYYFDATVAVSLTEKLPEYYDGLNQEFMNSYAEEYPAWNPKVRSTRMFELTDEDRNMQV